MKVYAIVVTYNGEGWIYRCLESLKKSNVNLHIIVIDNASTDRTVSIIKKGFSSVKVINSDINLGFGKGNNIGLKIALNENADYVFLLNQDAWVEPNTISKLIEIQNKNKEYGILSPFHLNYEKTEIEFYFSTIINAFDCPFFINDMHFNSFKDVYEIKFIHAACWLISNDCLETVGGFDPIFPHYSEDNDYVNRAKYFNFKIGVTPKCFVNHNGTNKGLTGINQNFNLQFNFVILHLKNINHKLRGLFLVHLKTSFDKITSAILYRRFKDFGFQIKLFWKSITMLGKIKKSRKITVNKRSFL